MQLRFEFQVSYSALFIFILFWLTPSSANMWGITSICYQNLLARAAECPQGEDIKTSPADFVRTVFLLPLP